VIVEELSASKIKKTISTFKGKKGKATKKVINLFDSKVEDDLGIEALQFNKQLTNRQTIHFNKNSEQSIL